MLRKNKSVGDLIRYYRIMKGYSQNDLAQRLNVTIAAISNWERGVSKPGVDIAIELTREMNMTLDEFYTVNAKQIFSDLYEINDLITFDHVFLNVLDYDVNLEEKWVKITLRLQGLTLIESIIQEDVEVLLETGDTIKRPFKKEIVESSPQVSTMSPELSKFPITARTYELTVKFEYLKLERFHLKITMNEQSTKIYFSECLNDLMVHGLKFDKDFEENIKRIKSGEFVEYLKFISKTRGFEYIRDYLLREYQKIIPKN